MAKAKNKSEGPVVVVHGNLGEGFDVHGPFDTFAEATHWVDYDAHLDFETVIMRLHNPYDEDELGKLVTALQAKGARDLVLGDLVHDVASEEASDVNNQGLAGQVQYLLSKGMTPGHILKFVDED